MKYKVMHLKDYNPKTYLYESEEYYPLDAVCDEVACCVFGKVVLEPSKNSQMKYGEGPNGPRLCGVELEINGRCEYFGLYKVNERI